MKIIKNFLSISIIVFLLDCFNSTGKISNYIIDDYDFSKFAESINSPSNCIYNAKLQEILSMGK
jgi:hypothetical protein